MAFQMNDKMLKNMSNLTDNAGKLSAMGKFKFEFIDIEKIVPSDKNFYHIDDIDNLAEDIEQNGLSHNIVVRKLENETYEIVSGERRFTAFQKLFKEKGGAYKFIPSKVVELNDVDAELELIQANAQVRTLTTAEILQQVERLKILYDTKRANGEKNIGNTQNVIASDLGMGTTQVAKYQKIANNLEPQVKDNFINGEISLAEALELTDVPKAEQVQVAEEIIEKKAEPEISYPTVTAPKKEKSTKIKKITYECPICKATVFTYSENLKIQCVTCDTLFNQI